MTKIFVAGHKGMVGSAICRQLKQDKSITLICKSRFELDLTNQAQVNKFFEQEKPDEIIIAAAKVGGIHANNAYPAEFAYENLQIQNSIIHSAHVNNVQKLLFLGSSCVYPKHADQPIKEDQLLSSPLESTNEPYAVAKIAGIKMCESYNRQYGRDYRSVMPTNLYGPGDNYHIQNSHVVPALIRRIHEAKINNLKKVCIWGTGKPMREFMFIEDMAEACIYLHSLKSDVFKEQVSPMVSHVNIGTGQDITIHDLAYLIKDTVGYFGDLVFDETKPDGTPRKLLDVSLLTALGWKAKISLQVGLQMTYDSFLEDKNVRY